MAVKKKFASLGRGLDALISTEDVRTEGSSTINEVALDLIEPNPNQPRREFDEEALQELAGSIAEIGIVQPITLRQMPNGRYQIIAGERRWRASQKAALRTIPAYIRTADDENMMEMALVENIQRQDLNPVEIALAYQHLIEQYHLTQEKLAERVGKNRATIANCLRLLKLPAAVQVALQQHTIDTGHARALLALDDPKQQVKLFEQIQQKGYSVRQVEQMVKQINEAKGGKPRSRAERSKTAQGKVYEPYRKILVDTFGQDARLTTTPSGAGKVTLAFKNEDELKRIIQRLNA